MLAYRETGQISKLQPLIRKMSDLWSATARPARNRLQPGPFRAKPGDRRHQVRGRCEGSVLSPLAPPAVPPSLPRVSRLSPLIPRPSSHAAPPRARRQDRSPLRRGRHDYRGRVCPAAARRPGAAPGWGRLRSRAHPSALTTAPAAPRPSPPQGRRLWHHPRAGHWRPRVDHYPILTTTRY